MSPDWRGPFDTAIRLRTHANRLQLGFTPRRSQQCLSLSARASDLSSGASKDVAGASSWGFKIHCDRQLVHGQHHPHKQSTDVADASFRRHAARLLRLGSADGLQVRAERACPLNPVTCLPAAMQRQGCPCPAHVGFSSRHAAVGVRVQEAGGG
jgi:hypothetical protein